MFDLLKKLNEKKIDKLIVDVRGNGGGYVYLSSMLLTWLNGKSQGFTQFLWRKRRSELADLIVEITKEEFYDYQTHEELNLEDFMNKKEYLHMNLIDDKGSYYEAPVEYTELFTLEPYSRVRNGKLENFAREDIAHPIFNMNRDDIYILGDGVGGSATGMFIWGAMQFMIGRSISVGGYKDELREYKAGFASYTGASVVDSDDFWNAIVASGKKDDRLPTAFPYGAGVSFTLESVMSYDTPSVLQEFREALGEKHIYYYSKIRMADTPDYEDDYNHKTLIDLVRSVWDSSTFENSLWPMSVKTTSTECKDSDETSVYGHLKNADSYTGGCAFLYCSDLHYYDYSKKTCVEIKGTDDVTDSAEDSSLTPLEIVFIITTVIFVIVSVVFIILWILEVRKKKSVSLMDRDNTANLN